MTGETDPDRALDGRLTKAARFCLGQIGSVLGALGIGPDRTVGAFGDTEAVEKVTPLTLEQVAARRIAASIAGTPTAEMFNADNRRLLKD